MALNGDQLGIELDAAMAQFNNVAIDTTNPTAMAAYRLQYWKAVGNTIVNHLKTNGVLKVPGTGLFAGQVPITGNSTTGKIE